MFKNSSHGQKHIVKSNQKLVFLRTPHRNIRKSFDPWKFGNSHDDDDEELSKKARRFENEKHKMPININQKIFERRDSRRLMRGYFSLLISARFWLPFSSTRFVFNLFWLFASNSEAFYCVLKRIFQNIEI